MKEFFQLLGSKTCLGEVISVTKRTSRIIRRDRISAVVAYKALRAVTPVVMKCHGNRAVLARYGLSAIFADQSPGKSSPVKKEYYLLIL